MKLVVYTNGDILLSRPCYVTVNESNNNHHNGGKNIPSMNAVMAAVRAANPAFNTSSGLCFAWDGVRVANSSQLIDNERYVAVGDDGFMLKRVKVSDRIPVLSVNETAAVDVLADYHRSQQMRESISRSRQRSTIADGSTGKLDSSTAYADPSLVANYNNNMNNNNNRSPLHQHRSIHGHEEEDDEFFNEDPPQPALVNTPHKQHQSSAAVATRRLRPPPGFQYQQQPQQHENDSAAPPPSLSSNKQRKPPIAPQPQNNNKFSKLPPRRPVSPTPHSQQQQQPQTGSSRRTESPIPENPARPDDEEDDVAVGLEERTEDFKRSQSQSESINRQFLDHHLKSEEQNNNNKKSGEHFDDRHRKVQAAVEKEIDKITSSRKDTPTNNNNNNRSGAGLVPPPALNISHRDPNAEKTADSSRKVTPVATSSTNNEQQQQQPKFFQGPPPAVILKQQKEQQKQQNDQQQEQIQEQQDAKRALQEPNKPLSSNVRRRPLTVPTSSAVDGDDEGNDQQTQQQQQQPQTAEKARLVSPHDADEDTVEESKNAQTLVNDEQCEMREVDQEAKTPAQNNNTSRNLEDNGHSSTSSANKHDDEDDDSPKFVCDDEAEKEDEEEIEQEVDDEDSNEKVEPFIPALAPCGFSSKQSTDLFHFPENTTKKHIDNEKNQSASNCDNSHPKRVFDETQFRKSFQNVLDLQDLSIPHQNNKHSKKQPQHNSISSRYHFVPEIVNKLSSDHSEIKGDANKLIIGPERCGKTTALKIYIDQILIPHLVRTENEEIIDHVVHNNNNNNSETQNSENTVPLLENNNTNNINNNNNADGRTQTPPVPSSHQPTLTLSAENSITTGEHLNFEATNGSIVLRFDEDDDGHRQHQQQKKMEQTNKPVSESRSSKSQMKNQLSTYVAAPTNSNQDNKSNSSSRLNQPNFKSTWCLPLSLKQVSKILSTASSSSSSASTSYLAITQVASHLVTSIFESISAHKSECSYALSQLTNYFLNALNNISSSSSSSSSTQQQQIPQQAKEILAPHTVPALSLQWSFIHKLTTSLALIAKASSSKSANNANASTILRQQEKLTDQLFKTIFRLGLSVLREALGFQKVILVVDDIDVAFTLSAKTHGNDNDASGNVLISFASILSECLRDNKSRVSLISTCKLSSQQHKKSDTSASSETTTITTTPTTATVEILRDTFFSSSQENHSPLQLISLLHTVPASSILALFGIPQIICIEGKNLATSQQNNIDKNTGSPPKKAGNNNNNSSGTGLIQVRYHADELFGGYPAFVLRFCEELKKIASGAVLLLRRSMTDEEIQECLKREQTFSPSPSSPAPFALVLTDFPELAPLLFTLGEKVFRLKNELKRFSQAEEIAEEEEVGDDRCGEKENAKTGGNEKMNQQEQESDGDEIIVDAKHDQKKEEDIEEL